MGEMMIKYYDFVAKKGGNVARYRLALATGIASQHAMLKPDSPENIKKFKEAVREITGEAAPEY